MPPRKRAASTVLDEPRRSRRISSTPKKSIYFETEDESDDPPSNGNGQKLRGKRNSANNAKLKEEEVFSDEYEEDLGDDGDDGEEDEEDEDRSEDDAGTKVTVVKVPGLRPDGGMEYADEYVHKNTALFLKDLKQNNERPWLKCKPPPPITKRFI